MRQNSLSRSSSVLPRLPVTLLLRHDATPSLSHHVFGCTLSPTFLWDVPSPLPRSGMPWDTPSLWDAPPSFLFSTGSLTVHRVPPLAHGREVGFFHDAAPFHSQTRGATLQPSSAFFLIFFPFSFSFADCSFSHMSPSCLYFATASRRPSSPLSRRFPIPSPPAFLATRRLPLPPLTLGVWDTSPSLPGPGA